jgi:hypothetical protein
LPVAVKTISRAANAINIPPGNKPEVFRSSFVKPGMDSPKSSYIRLNFLTSTPSLLDEVDYSFTAESLSTFTDRTFHETRVADCQIIPDDTTGWTPPPVVFGHPEFISPPTAGPIVIEYFDNTVKVILKDTSTQKRYNISAGDLKIWELIREGILGAGGNISIDIPVEESQGFYRAEVFEDGE